MDTNYIEDLLNHRYTLQRDILNSWEHLRKAKEQHAALLRRLPDVREQIKFECEGDLYTQLFGDNP